MVTRENRAELEVFRTVTIVDSSFLRKVRVLASAAFGESNYSRATFRPPLVVEPIAVAAGEPLAKVYDAPNLKLPILWRVSVFDNRAGNKFFKARQILDNGVKEKQEHGVSTVIYRNGPLIKRMAEGAQQSEIGPDVVVPLVCSSITSYRHRLLHPGTDIYCLTPDFDSAVYLGLMNEQMIAEDCLAETSGYVYNKQNPQPQLMIPFMRVDSTSSEEQRNNFRDNLLTPNIFPVDVLLSNVEISTSS